MATPLAGLHHSGLGIVPRRNARSLSRRNTRRAAMERHRRRTDALQARSRAAAGREIRLPPDHSRSRVDRSNKSAIVVVVFTTNAIFFVGVSNQVAGCGD